MRMHGASNRDTHLCPPHSNSSAHLTTTTYVRRSGRITNGMWSGWTTLRDSLLSSAVPAPTLLKWPFREQCGFGFHLRTGVGRSRSACANVVWLWVWRRRTNCRSLCPPMANPSTIPWTASPNGSVWWDHRMAAEDLPRDLVAKQWTVTTRSKEEEEAPSRRKEVGTFGVFWS